MAYNNLSHVNVNRKISVGGSMPKKYGEKYRTIHMPTLMYEEVKRVIERGALPYKSIDELCREAGRELIRRYKLGDP